MTLQLAKNFEHATTHLLPKIAKGLIVGYDWLASPAMSDQERLNHELAATEPVRHFNGISL